MASASKRRAATAPSPRAPIVTLTTDFGSRDPFVGIMKGVILGIAPAARIVDLTHGVPPQAVLAGAHALASAAPYFPRGTIHVVVVDPGVGTRRRALVVETRDAWLVGPDNGCLSLAAPARAVRRIVDVSRTRRRLTPTSATFHGRDVFAPVAAALAAGVDAATLGPRIASMKRLGLPRSHRRAGALLGEVLWADGFGNLVTNVGHDTLAAAGFRGPEVSVTIGAHVLPIRASYADVPAGELVALVNSTSLLEIAVSGGSAAARLGASAGTPVRVSAAGPSTFPLRAGRA